MEFELINQWDSFLNIKDQWNELVKKITSPQVFYKYEWAKCYIENIQPELKKDLCIVVVKEKKEWICILPFILNKGVVRFIMSSTVDYSQIYIDKSYNKYVIIDKSIRYLIEKCNNIKEFALTNFPSSDELYCIEDVLRKVGYSAFIEENVIVPKLPCNSNPMKFQKKQIKNTDRRERRLLENYTVDFDTTDILSDDVLNFIAEYRNKKYPNNTLQNDIYLRFYKQLCVNIKSNVYVNTVRLNGKLASAHMGFVDENKVYYYIPAYDEQYAQDGIGLVMLNHLIGENNINKEFDFLRGNEDYKFYYCDNVSMNFYLWAYKKSPNQLMPRLFNKMKNSKFIRKCLGR